MDTLTRIIIVYLHAQVTDGVNALQLFDSWAGCLSEWDYQQNVLPYSRRVFDSLSAYKDVPLIHFGTNTAGFLKTFSDVSCQVISVDWRVSVSQARKMISHDKALQGNLDPVILLSDKKNINRQTDVIFEQLQTRKGFIFNLGHGVLPSTPVDMLKNLTAYVHEK
jgi:uroporphyrinogen decarboxylase